MPLIYSVLFPAAIFLALLFLIGLVFAAFYKRSTRETSLVIACKIATQRLEALPAIIREMVAPANNIDSIKVHQVSGMPMGGGAQGGAAGEAVAAPRGAIDQVYDAITQMAVQMPALKALGDSVGVSFGDGVNGVLGTDFAPVVKPAEKAE